MLRAWTIFLCVSLGAAATLTAKGDGLAGDMSIAFAGGLLLGASLPVMAWFMEQRKR